VSGRRPAGEDGSVLVLVLGLTAVLLALVAVVVDVSAVVLARRGVSSAADGAAVAAAQGLDLDAFYRGGVDGGVPLSEQEVARRVAEYADEAAVGQPGLALESSVEDGVTARVLATRTVALPLGGRLGRDGVTVRAQARARAPLTP